MWSSISVVIPVYNSSKTLEILVERLDSELKKLCYKYEIIMVDDCSRDDSFNVMKKIYDSEDNIKIVKLSENFGQQNAIICGFNEAEGDYVVTIDDDLQHLPEEIGKLLEEIDKGYDVVYGIPEKKQHSRVRNFGTEMTNLLFNKLFNKPEEIRISSFRVVKREIVDRIKGYRDSFVYISALTFKNTRNIGNVSVAHNPREHGRSNYNVYKLFKLYIKIYVYYSNNVLVSFFKSKKPQYIVEKKHL